MYRVIDCNMRLARAFLAQLPPNTGAFGEVRECRASTRRGTPCQREPLPGRDYCPPTSTSRSSTRLRRLWPRRQSGSPGRPAAGWGLRRCPSGTRPLDFVQPAGEDSSPLRKILRRLAIAVALVVFVALVSYAGRGGYTDPEDGETSLLDAFYYSTVSITTTGYGTSGRLWTRRAS